MDITNRVRDLFANGRYADYVKHAVYSMALVGASFLYTCGPGTDASLSVKGNKDFVYS